MKFRRVDLTVDGLCVIGSITAPIDFFYSLAYETWLEKASAAAVRVCMRPAWTATVQVRVNDFDYAP